VRGRFAPHEVALDLALRGQAARAKENIGSDFLTPEPLTLGAAIT
jgi:hypothetical protein